jgi:putative endonuclease
MALHNTVGTDGENLAAAWLTEKGYKILHRNWRYSYFEIDIIALRSKMLHFVEVKCRNASPFGYPEDSVTKKKFKNLQRAADQFLFLNPGHKWIQYDILSITLYKDKEPEFFLLEDVFL